MNAIVTRKHGLPIESLELAATQIGAGLKDAQFGQAVLARMPATVQTDYDANLTALVKAIADQAVARGVVSTRVAEQTKALNACSRRTRAVRSLAKRDFAGQAPLLHSDFAVGENESKAVDAILARAEKTRAGCAQHAELLEQSGWPAASTTALAAAITAAKEANLALFNAKAVKKAATGNVIALANAMYDLCRKVQIVADDEYPAESAQLDPSVIEARGKFLLGSFPPRVSATTNEAGDPPTVGGTPGSSGGTAPAAATGTS